jgi:hypothetical protein
MQVSDPSAAMAQKTLRGSKVYPRTRAFASIRMRWPVTSTPSDAQNCSMLVRMSASGSPMWSAALKVENGRSQRGSRGPVSFGTASRSTSHW